MAFSSSSGLPGDRKREREEVDPDIEPTIADQPQPQAAEAAAPTIAGQQQAPAGEAAAPPLPPLPLPLPQRQHQASERGCNQCLLCESVTKIELLQVVAAENNVIVSLGVSPCSIYILSSPEGCHRNNNEPSSWNPQAVVKHMNASINVAKKMLSKGLPVQAISLSYNEKEHIHSWILTHSDEASKLTKDRSGLDNPLSPEDPMVQKLGLCRWYGTARRNRRNFTLAAKLYRQRSTKPYDTDEVHKKNLDDLKSILEQKEIEDKENIYLFWYPGTETEILISFQKK